MSYLIIVLLHLISVPLGTYASPRMSVAGDSITVAPEYLELMGLWGGDVLRECQYDVYDQASLQYLRDGNVFTNHSIAAKGGWTAGDVLDPEKNWVDFCGEGESPLECEIRYSQPSQMHIMFGTNDPDVQAHYQNMREIITTLQKHNVLPVLYTAPPFLHKDMTPFNENVHQLAQQFNIPLVDYYTAMTQLEGYGLSEDGVHPSLEGYNLRNCMTLLTLEELYRGN